jgi:transposase
VAWGAPSVASGGDRAIPSPPPHSIYDAEPHRDLCRSFGVTPQIHTRGQPPGSGLGQRRWPVERSNAWVLENKRLALRYDRLGFIIQSLLQSACIFLVANRLARQF